MQKKEHMKSSVIIYQVVRLRHSSAIKNVHCTGLAKALFLAIQWPDCSEKMEQKAFADQANKELIDRQVAQCRSDSQRARARDKMERKF